MDKAVAKRAPKPITFAKQEQIPSRPPAPMRWLSNIRNIRAFVEVKSGTDGHISIHVPSRLDADEFLNLIADRVDTSELVRANGVGWNQTFHADVWSQLVGTVEESHITYAMMLSFPEWEYSWRHPVQVRRVVQETRPQVCFTSVKQDVVALAELVKAAAIEEITADMDAVIMTLTEFIAEL